MKGVFIPEITVEMLRSASLDTIEEFFSKILNDDNEVTIFNVELPKWIPCSERLPKDDGEYLVWMQWDFEEEPSYSIVNYDANAEAFGEWHEYFDPDTLGSLGSDFRSFKGVFAWMPLPEPYGERRTDEAD